MPIIVATSNKQFELASEGAHRGVLADVQDLGEVETAFGVKPKIRLKWLLEELETDRQHHQSLIQTVNKNLHEKSEFSKVVRAITGKQPDPGEGDFDVGIGAHPYRSPMFAFSIEAATDLEAYMPLVDFAEVFLADRIARGVAADLVKADGVSKPILGLIPSLQVLTYGIGRTAAGSSSNDGGAGTGANSIGSDDLVALFYSVDSAYRASSKCAFLMNDGTAQAIGQLKDRNGRVLLDLNAPRWSLMGKPVRISPSMDSIGASKFPIAFGDFSYWVTRYVRDSGYIMRFDEVPGLVERGIIGVRAFCRFDGALLVQDDLVVKPPIRLLQNAS